jgi:predicted RNase H-like HicB family nuclease
MNLQILLEHSSDGGYTVTVPALPGCISEGETREEAITNIEEAIALYLEPVSDDYLVVPEAELLEIAI